MIADNLPWAEVSTNRVYNDNCENTKKEIRFKHPFYSYSRSQGVKQIPRRLILLIIIWSTEAKIFAKTR